MPPRLVCAFAGPALNNTNAAAITKANRLMDMVFPFEKCPTNFSLSSASAGDHIIEQRQTEVCRTSRAAFSLILRKMVCRFGRDDPNRLAARRCHIYFQY